MTKFLVGLGIIIFIIFSIVCLISQYDNEINQIKNKVEDLNGKLIEYKSKSFDIGPFKWWEKGKYDHVYKFIYIKHDQIYEGWVLFYSWGKVKWVINRKVGE